MRFHAAVLTGLLCAGLAAASIDTAQDFTATDADGQTYNLYSLLDAGKVVITHFITAS